MTGKFFGTIFGGILYFLVVISGGSILADSKGPVIEIWYGEQQQFGKPGNAQQWVNILGNISDVDGIASLRYTLNNGAEQPLSVGPDQRRLLSKGDFNIELNYQSLAEGVNQVTVIATDELGNQSVKVVTINYTSGKTWPLPYEVIWKDVEALQDVVQIVDGKWQFSDAGVRSVDIGYDRVVAVGDIAWRDYEVTVPITIHGVDSEKGFEWPSVSPGLGILLHWRGHTARDDSQPRYGWLPSGANSWYGWNDKNNLEKTVLSISGEDGAAEDPERFLHFDVSYIFKMRVEALSGGGNRYRLKVWEKEAPEPEEWHLSHDEGVGLSNTFAEKFHARSSAEKKSAWKAKKPFHDVDYQKSSSKPHERPLHHYNIVSKNRGSQHKTTAPNSTPDLDSGSLLLITHHVDATFGDIRVTPLTDGQLPGILNIQAAVDETEATITWSTTKPTRALFRYGLTDAYELDDLQNAELKTEHQVQFQLSALKPNRVYHFQISVTDAEGNNRMSADQVFHTPGAMRLTSDDFNSETLNTERWQYINPLEDAILSLSGTQVAIELPADQEHDVWGDNNIAFSNTVPRIMQACADENLDIEVKFDGALSGNAQQGILIQQDAANMLRLEFLSNGAGLYVFGASFTNGIANVLFYKQIGNSGVAPLYLQVKREGPQWTLGYAYDGETFNTIAPFQHQMIVTAAGVYGGNYPGTTHRVLVDYFKNHQDPVEAVPPLLSHIEATSSETEAIIQWHTDKPANGTVRYGTSSAYELGQRVHSDFDTRHRIILPNLMSATEYHYQIISEDADKQKVISNDFIFKTRAVGVANSSDEFNGSKLDSTQWEFVNPLNDAILKMTGSQAAISVPYKRTHHIGGYPLKNTAPAILQKSADEDFEIESKFDSGLKNGALQGILIRQDPQNFLKLELIGNSYRTYLVIATVENGVASVHDYQWVSRLGVAPIYVKVKRDGDQWQVMYSLNGASYTSLASLTFHLKVAETGVYSGNYLLRGCTMLVDYFHQSRSNTADTTPPIISNINVESGVTDAIISWTTDESATGGIRYGLTGGYEVDSIATEIGVQHRATVSHLMPNTMYHYHVSAEDASGNTVMSTDLTFSTQKAIEPGNASDEFNTTTLNTDLWTFINPLDDATLVLNGTQLTISVPSESEHDVWGDASIPFSNTLPRIMQACRDENFEIEVKFDVGLNGNAQQGILIAQDEKNLLRLEFLSNGSHVYVFAAGFREGIASIKTYRQLGTSGLAPLYMWVQRNNDNWTLAYSLNGTDYTTVSSFSHTMAVSAAGVYAGNYPGTAYTGKIDYFRKKSDNVLNILAENREHTILDIAAEPFKEGIKLSWKTDWLADTRVIYGHADASETNSQKSVKLREREYLDDVPETDVGAENNIEIADTVRGDVLLKQHEVVIQGLKPGTDYQYKLVSVDAKGRVAAAPMVLNTGTFSEPLPGMPRINEVEINDDRTAATISWEADQRYSGYIKYGMTKAYELGKIENLFSADVFVDPQKNRKKNHITITGLIPDTQYYYQIVLIGENDELVSMTEQMFYTVPGGKQELPEKITLPERFRLYANYPNPFNPSTTIRFDIPGKITGEAKTWLIIYNMLGQKVKAVFQGNLTAGSYQMKWDGTNDAGYSVASGVYIATLETAHYRQSIKMLLIK